MKKINLLSLAIGLVPLSASLSACQVAEQEEISVLIPYYQGTKDNKFETFLQIINKFNSEYSSEIKQNKIILRNSFSPRQINYKLSLELMANDKNLPSIVVSYPSVVPLINKYNRLVDLSNIAANTSLPKHILDYNNRLGIANENKIYNLPLGLSSQILIINKKILADYLFSLYVFAKNNNIQNKHILNMTQDAYIKSIITSYYDLNLLDKASITDFNIDTLRQWDLEINEELFDNQKDFEKLCELINKSLKTRGFDILFLKHIENYIFETIFKKNNSDFSNYFLKYDRQNKLEYQKVFKKNTEENIEFSNVIKDLYNNLKLKNFNVDYDNKNTSITKLKNQLFTIITSRIYEHESEYFKENEKDLIIKSTPLKYDTNQLNKSYFLQGQFLSAISSNKKSKNIIVKKFLSWLYDNKNIYDWKLNQKNIKASPIEFLNLNLGYVYPTQSFINIYDNYKNNDNKANKVILNNIINKDLVPFSDPVDWKSASFRNILKKTVFDSLVSSAQKNMDTKQAIDNFIDYLLKLIK
ncbi:hypothetical protein OF364_02805 [Mycoplasma enhydrae]|uniref:hypothetical protein n=1 Tax=Mycoplasma enhydrae TaxID=2499220 RepID=UPI0021E84D93|nr:hypothetical protein [Mycoplasma enhydrae]MCV3753732.1 hypothetical protein [Mycoplasma enhydrae]